MAQTTAREVRDDPGHDLKDVLQQMANHNSGFVNNFVSKYPKSFPTDRQEIMSYYADGALPALHALAKNFTVCDRWFSSMPGPTWPNRLFLYSGTSWGFTDMNTLHYWDQPTLFDELSAGGVSWKLYYGDISSTYILVISPIRCPALHCAISIRTSKGLRQTSRGFASSSQDILERIPMINIRRTTSFEARH
jgi:phospholipase C